MLREIIDTSGERWRVWEVQPRWIERRLALDPVVLASVGERRLRNTGEVRLLLNSELSNGWLAFESESARGRVHPVPPNWSRLSDAELREMLEGAKTKPKSRRLIE